MTARLYRVIDWLSGGRLHQAERVHLEELRERFRLWPCRSCGTPVAGEIDRHIIGHVSTARHHYTLYCDGTEEPSE